MRQNRTSTIYPLYYLVYALYIVLNTHYSFAHWIMVLVRKPCGGFQFSILYSALWLINPWLQSIHFEQKKILISRWKTCRPFDNASFAYLVMKHSKRHSCNGYALVLAHKMSKKLWIVDCNFSKRNF